MMTFQDIKPGRDVPVYFLKVVKAILPLCYFLPLPIVARAVFLFHPSSRHVVPVAEYPAHDFCPPCFIHNRHHLSCSDF
jgi:hypothetical protein